jgi:hypothetical protein
MSIILTALDRMDFWSRELVLQNRRINPERLPDRLEARATRIEAVIAVAQFQAAQEAAKEAQC